MSERDEIALFRTAYRTGRITEEQLTRALKARAELVAQAIVADKLLDDGVPLDKAITPGSALAVAVDAGAMHHTGLRLVES